LKEFNRELENNLTELQEGFANKENDNQSLQDNINEIEQLNSNPKA
jgi:hypothetical protein